MKRNGRTADVLKLVRCAIYTRKSTEDGLEQEFNSLDAQREAGEMFVRSQAGEGWSLLADRYGVQLPRRQNDLGFGGSGATYPCGDTFGVHTCIVGLLCLRN